MKILVGVLLSGCSELSWLLTRINGSSKGADCRLVTYKEDTKKHEKPDSRESSMWVERLIQHFLSYFSLRPAPQWTLLFFPPSQLIPPFTILWVYTRYSCKCHHMTFFRMLSGLRDSDIIVKQTYLNTNRAQVATISPHLFTENKYYLKIPREKTNQCQTIQETNTTTTTKKNTHKRNTASLIHMTSPSITLLGLFP